MKAHEQLIAYLATLSALVVVFLGAMAFAAWGSLTSVESFGVGTITGGLIGLMRAPQQRQVEIEQPTGKPVPVEETH